MEELFKYFIQETNERLDKIQTQLTDLQTFKINMLAQARLTAFLVSGVCGFVTLISTVLLVWYTRLSIHS